MLTYFSLLHELGYSSQGKNEEGEIEPSSWDFCKDLFEKRVGDIIAQTGASEPLFFLTNTPYINKALNRSRTRNGEATVDYSPNFRLAITQEFKDEEGEVFKTKDYKGNRKSDKPFHFYNITNHILSSWPHHVAENGLEADDAMCIEQYKRLDKGDTIICSRDKDLKQCPGWHYSWEANKQPEWGPEFVTQPGYLKDVSKDAKKRKIMGVGDAFFYYQMLTGDGVDNVAGVIGKGPAFAYGLLHDLESSYDMYILTAEVFVKTYGDEWKKQFRTMADLLWMIREVDDNGVPVRWKRPVQ